MRRAGWRTPDQTLDRRCALDVHDRRERFHRDAHGIQQRRVIPRPGMSRSVDGLVGLGLSSSTHNWPHRRVTTDSRNGLGPRYAFGSRKSRAGTTSGPRVSEPERQVSKIPFSFTIFACVRTRVTEGRSSGGPMRAEIWHDVEENNRRGRGRPVGRRADASRRRPPSPSKSSPRLMDAVASRDNVSRSEAIRQYSHYAAEDSRQRAQTWSHPEGGCPRVPWNRDNLNAPYLPPSPVRLRRLSTHYLSMPLTK